MGPKNALVQCSYCKWYSIVTEECVYCNVPIKCKKSARFIEENTREICNECKGTLEDDHSCKHLHFDDFNREDNMLNNVTCIDARFVDDDSSTDFT